MDKDYHKKYREEYKKKVKYINVAIPMPMYQELEKLAEVEDEKVATLIRNMALAHMKQKTMVPKTVETELKEFIFLMRNIANNINQIAHHSNIVKHIVDENGLLMEIKRLEDLVKDYTLNKLKK
jgi:rRNA-processing protein FCF1